ncbi:Choline/Carnitine O-acyltransferase [Ancylostoma ceylanicum]|uniref:Choline/Carnitine O-acyltransferase n=1 Tax=Ancylostoma ceylanicum TaxID=53326 RepID=A0A0D6L709_9BILA|nr:Choline/Carnitine O-acyltransferase [Ancylostoma ceylanicum]
MVYVNEMSHPARPHHNSIQATALLNDQQRRKTTDAVEKFRKSTLAKQLQDALVRRSEERRNWLEDWWYDAYNEVREPLVPYLSLASSNSTWTPLEGSQICRAADDIYYWMRFWEKIRKGTLPIMRSRGVIWDMHQYHCLFNSCRVPEMPKDRIYRYFKTESDGDCPSHITVLCRGKVWRVEMLRDGELKTPDELHHVLSYIDRSSKDDERSVACLTTQNRDKWAKNRASLISSSPTNERHIRSIEESCFCLTLTDNTYETTPEED